MVRFDPESKGQKANVQTHSVTTIDNQDTAIGSQGNKLTRNEYGRWLNERGHVKDSRISESSGVIVSLWNVGDPYNLDANIKEI